MSPIQAASVCATCSNGQVGALFPLLPRGVMFLTFSGLNSVQHQPHQSQYEDKSCQRIQALSLLFTLLWHTERGKEKTYQMLLGDSIKSQKLKLGYRCKGCKFQSERRTWETDFFTHFACLFCCSDCVCILQAKFLSWWFYFITILH